MLVADDGVGSGFMSRAARFLWIMIGRVGGGGMDEVPDAPLGKCGCGFLGPLTTIVS